MTAPPDKTVAAYGSWESPVSPEMLVERAVGLSDVQLDGPTVYWNEARPSEGGRQVIVALDASGDGQVHDAIPQGFSARSQVHEYGGRCYAVMGGRLVFSNWTDQRLWLVDPRGEPAPLTPEAPGARAWRYADPVITSDGRFVICVRERHRAGAEAINDLVAVHLDAPGSDPVELASGHDFYSAPRVSPDGSRLAWLVWDHPNMPWDSTELWVAELGGDCALSGARRVAGGPGESVTQPRWSPAGVLHYVSDRSGWWNLYDETGKSLCPMDAEFGEPDWVFGNSTFAFLPDGRLLASWSEGGSAHLGIISGGTLEEADLSWTEYSGLEAGEDGIIAIAASPTEALAVVRLGLHGSTLDGTVEILRRGREVVPDPASVSKPEAIAFPTGGGQVAHALFYPPANDSFRGPDGELPPLMVKAHGGPTSSARPILNLEIQFWTSRGFAVADVDYRGSSGYGRTYRRLLEGAWGVADVEDCAEVVRFLSAAGRVDGRRAVIRGASAGGFTVLAALAFTDVFAAGGDLYGIADLELLAHDTHKFESRYGDRLVGPLPEAVDEYRRRSPIHHVERIGRPLIIFQGLEDQVVPPAQSQMIYEAMLATGVPVCYLAFQGEQHGFRQASTIVRVAQAELLFYGRVLGFKPAGSETWPPIEIKGEEALPPEAGPGQRHDSGATLEGGP